jgi:hypothetical protein
LDVTLDFQANVSFEPIDWLNIFFSISLPPCPSFASGILGKEILTVTCKSRQFNEQFSILDMPFAITLEIAKWLAINCTSLAPDRSFDRVLYKQKLNFFDSEIFHSSLLAQCLMSTLAEL